MTGATYRAVVVGGTGAVGSALVRELLSSPACEQVVALTRRPAPELGTAARLAVHVVEFANLTEETRAAADGCTVAFCTMGVGQPRKMRWDDVWRVDVEWAGAFARGAQAAGAVHVSLLSSVGADAASRNPYLRMKGEAERAVSAAGITRTSLFRPSLLVTRNVRYGLQDRVTQAVFPWMQPLLPRRFHSIRVEDLGRAMRVNAERPGSPGLEVLEHPQFAGLLGATERAG